MQRKTTQTPVVAETKKSSPSFLDKLSKFKKLLIKIPENVPEKTPEKTLKRRNSF